MKVFVTGATGFIGEHLVKELIKRGNEVVALYRSESKKKLLADLPIKWYKGDLLDIEVLDQAIDGCDQVYHVAAYAVAFEEKPGDFRKYNVQGTVNVLEAALKHGVKKVVFTSTAGIFGPSVNGKIVNEKSVTQIPYFTGYEASKAEAENILPHFIKKGLNVVIVNPTRVFGPGQLTQSNSVTLMIYKYIKGQWHFIPGNGQSIGNYVFVEDVVNGHILAMEKGKTGERYILGGENVSYNEFFNLLQQVSGKKYTLIHIPRLFMLTVAYVLMLVHKVYRKFIPPFTPNHIRKFMYNWNVSTDKAKFELGYKVTPLKDAILKTISSFK